MLNMFENVFGIKKKFFLEYQEYKMSIFGIFFILYFLKLSACRGFQYYRDQWCTYRGMYEGVNAFVRLGERGQFIYL